MSFGAEKVEVMTETSDNENCLRRKLLWEKAMVVC